MQSDCHVSVPLHFTAWMLKLWSWQPRCSFLKKSSIASLIDSNSRNKDKQNQTPTNICAHVLLNPIRHFLYTKYWLTAADCFCRSLSGLVWNEAEPEKTASAKGASVINCGAWSKAKLWLVSYDGLAKQKVVFVGSFCRPCLPLATGPLGPFDPIKRWK